MNKQILANIILLGSDETPAVTKLLSYQKFLNFVIVAGTLKKDRNKQYISIYPTWLYQEHTV